MNRDSKRKRVEQARALATRLGIERVVKVNGDGDVCINVEGLNGPPGASGTGAGARSGEFSAFNRRLAH